MSKGGANTLREMRLRKRLTQAEVAKKFRVSQAYYSAVERGEKAKDVPPAMKVVSEMRKRMDRTTGGDSKAGRIRG